MTSRQAETAMARKRERSLRRRQVMAWLGVKRSAEMSIPKSVRIWLGQDAMGAPNRLPTPEIVKRNEESLRLLELRQPKLPGATNPCKQSIMLDPEMLLELKAEAARQNRTMSWLVQRSWILAKDRLRSMKTIR